MKPPLTNIQEVLYTLIEQGHVSIFDFPYLSGFRTRVSEIHRKHQIGLKSELNTRCNKFGNSYTYAIHFLPKEQKQKAIDVYNKLTKEKRKRQLESELKEVIDKFHKENRIYKVTYVSAKSNITEVMGRKNEILNSPVRVEVNIEVI